MITWLATGDSPETFPPVSRAQKDPNGLLAAGGDLSPARLIAAYRRGIFPWYSPGQQILWWSPDPREVIWPARFHVSRSLKYAIAHCDGVLRWDGDFAATIDGCAAPRSADSGTWITPEMRQAYLELNRLGHARSLELWRRDQLIGGLYGVQLGAVFFAESMFSGEPNASKIVLAHLCADRRGGSIELIDCQIANPHLRSLGSEAIERTEFLQQLSKLGAAAEPARS